MRVYGLAVSVLMLVMTAGAQSGTIWSTLVPAITSQLVSLWKNKELEFIGHTCDYNQRPRFYKWRLYYHGKFSCPSWTGIRGEAKTSSKSGVMTRTIENYLNKVRAAGLVTEEEARLWLEGQSG